MYRSNRRNCGTLTTDVTTANVPDNKMYIPLSLYLYSLYHMCYTSHDPDYDDKNLYEYGKKVLGIDLICPVERYENTSKKRLELVCFYEWYWDRLYISKEEYL